MANPTQDLFDTNRLLAYIQSENLEAPLVLLNDSAGEFDPRLNQANRAVSNHLSVTWAPPSMLRITG